jgi:hypothetical protein
MINDIGSPAFSARTLPPVPRPTISYRNDVIENSRAMYAKPKDAVENAINEWFVKDVVAAPERKPRPVDGQAPREFSKQQQYSAPTQGPKREAYRPSETQQQRESYQQKDKAPETHSPFKKAFSRPHPVPRPAFQQALRPTVQTVIAPLKEDVSPEDTVVHEVLVETPVHESPKVTELLDSLSFEKTDQSQNVVTTETHTTTRVVEVTTPPFDGEQTLRAQMPIKKSIDRGPSEKNKDLLRNALLGIGVVKQTPPAESTTVSSVSQTTTTQQAATPEQAAQPKAPEEVSYQTIRKVLE